MTTYSIQEVLKPFEEELHSSTDTISKDKVLAFRVEPALFSLLESLTEKWNTSGTSATVRNILSMYFLPVVYELEWKNLKPEQLQEFLTKQNEEGSSVKASRFNVFMLEVAEYISFLKEAEEKGSESLEYIKGILNKLEGIVQETENKFSKVLFENEKKP